MRLENKVALVTGAGRGIGKAIALAYAREGADVAINDLAASVKDAEAVVQEIKALGRRAMFAPADMSLKTEVDGMVAAVTKNFGRLDILVNNAGFTLVAPSVDFDEKKWRYSIDVLLNGVFFASQAAAKDMMKRRSGRIINMGSIAGLGGIPERAAYCAAKAGVMALTKVLGCEWAQWGINVNAIAPSWVKTDLVAGLIAKGMYQEEALTGRVPQGRLAKPEDIAAVAVFLASEEASYINAQSIVVDGGMSTYIYLESWLKDKAGK
ncbi:MAG: 3-oxoacyl-ACP reductase FabG [Dehalococcoidales bacterium]|nr:3-oxoacyl-ACP reductase FabG [Dehalococcoidales bacterium]